MAVGLLLRPGDISIRNYQLKKRAFLPIKMAGHVSVLAFFVAKGGKVFLNRFGQPRSQFEIILSFSHLLPEILGDTKKRESFLVNTFPCSLI